MSRYPDGRGYRPPPVFFRSDERQPSTLLAIRALYARQDRIEPCACGEAIRLPGDQSRLLAQVMAAHQRTPAHQLWREAQ